MALNEDEKQLLVKLLNKADNTEIKGAIWHELVRKFVTTTIEMCVLDNRSRILLVRRLANDPEFTDRPYHMPGTVICDWETVDQARERLIKSEINSIDILKITEPKPIGWMEFHRGGDQEKNSNTRHTIALLHIARFEGEFSEKENAGFFPIDSIPENVIGCHKFMTSIFKRYLEDGQIILGE